MKEQDLIKTIKVLDNYEEAAEALSELAFSNKDEAEKLSLEILKNGLGDIFFQASAFDTLYEVNYKSAISFANKKLAGIHIYLLNTIINNVTVDSEIIEERPELKEFVLRIKERSEELNKSEKEDIKDNLEWFLDSFNL